jgi:hypothetical protein
MSGEIRSEANMITSKVLVAVAIVSTMGAVSAQSFRPSMPGKETSTRPWTAPVGHRQPRASDVSAPAPGTLLDQEDTIVDRRISGICRGC